MDTKTTRQAWWSGINRELDWWRSYLAGGGLSQPEEFRFRFDPAAPLQPHLARALPSHRDGAGHQMLDCAAGPATTLGKTRDGRPLAITAVDALAQRYQELLGELGLVPPVPTLPGEVERLETRFAADRFDPVYRRFARDHCYDPLAALRQMARVARPGGVVMVEYYRDEAETAYQGAAAVGPAAGAGRSGRGQRARPLPRRRGGARRPVGGGVQSHLVDRAPPQAPASGGSPRGRTRVMAARTTGRFASRVATRQQGLD